MRIYPTWALGALASLLLLSGSTKAATTYYSQGGSDPGLLGNWNSNRGGGGAAPANFNSGDTFAIQNSHLMNTIGAWTVSGAGGAIQIELGGTLVANNIVAVPTFQVDNGGTYIHNAVSGSANGSASDVPGASSRTFATNSTEEFQKWANGGSSPTALPSPVTWGNLKINVASLAGSWNQVGTLNSVAGGLTIQQTGGGAREFRLVANSVSGTTTVGANLRVEGGVLTFSSGTATATVNVAGSLTVAGGALQEATSTGSGPLNVTNAIFVGGGVLAIGPNPFPSSPVSFTIDGGALKASASGVIPAGRVISIGANSGELGTVSSAAGTLTLSNNFVGAAGLTIHAGTVVLAGTNSFTGNLTIAGVSSTNNPTVRFHSDFAAGMGQIVVSPTDPGVTTILSRSISGTTTVTNDMVVNSGGFQTLLSALSSSSITFSGKISGSATLSRANFIEGTVTLLGDNSGWSGGLVLQEGITRLGHKNALGTGPLSIIPGSDGVYLQAALPLSGINAVTNSVNIVNSNANTLGLYGTNDFEMAGPMALSGGTAMLDCSGSGVRILSGAISGDPGVGLAKFNSSSGTLTLTAANTYTGPTTISAGKLVVNGSLASTNVTVNSPGILGGIGAIGGPVTVNNAGSISPGSSAGILTLTNGLNLSGGGTNVWELATNSTANPGIAFDQMSLPGGTLTLGGSSRLLINFIGSATAPDTLTPFWQSSHTWTIISLSGTATNAGNSNFASIAGTNGIAAGTFSTSVNAGSIVLAYTPMTNRAPMTLTWSGGGANAFWSNSTNWVGNIAPQNGDALVFPVGAARLVNTNPVGGPTNFASLTLSGSNYVMFSPSLTLTNGFTNSPPSLRSNRLEAAIALGGDQTWKLIAAAGTLTLASNVTLGPFHLNLIGLASPTLEVLGNITGSAGSQVFMDGGVLKLSGPANDIPDFQVNSGNLQMNGVLSGGLSIAIGARLLGTGTVPAFTCDGSFQPGGPAAPGAMTISSGSTVFTSGSDFEIDLFGSASPGVNYDQVRVSTPPDLSGATLNVTPFYSATNGETFVIITNTGISPFTTTFPGFPEGKVMVFSSPANEFRISYAGGDGNAVTLKRVPLGSASAPRLTIQTAGANAVRLLWPTNPPLFNLESNTNLAGTNWTVVSPAPVVIGTNNVVTNSFTPTPKFYRLKK